MSNSSLVCYKKISPNKTSPRTSKIDTISIHCMAGNLSIETCGKVFAPTSRQASSNYGIGSDGRIGMYVEEKDRSWCTSSKSNDHRAVTIEVANDGGAPDWHVSDKAMKSLINLCADICKRNGIKKLVWSTKKDDRVNHKNGCNMTVHRDYSSKSCPGDYLYGKHSYIASEVNKILNGNASQPSKPTEPSKPVEPSKPTSVSYKVKITASSLYVRSGPGTTYKAVTSVKKGEIYTIVQEKSGWGKLKSGAGWISLNHTSKVVTSAKKSVTEIAKEVIAGKWGNGSDRKKKLEAAGYDYNAVQNAVNKLLG